MGLNYKVDYGSESNVMIVMEYAKLRIHGMCFLYFGEGRVNYSFRVF